MALIKCPECGHEISDQALSCPNCGAPTERGEEQREQDEVNARNNAVRSNGCVTALLLLMAIAGFIIMAVGAFHMGYGG